LTHHTYSTYDLYILIVFACNYPNLEILTTNSSLKRVESMNMRHILLLTNFNTVHIYINMIIHNNISILLILMMTHFILHSRPLHNCCRHFPYAVLLQMTYLAEQINFLISRISKMMTVEFNQNSRLKSVFLYCTLNKSKIII
jgi:hypothetical protein